MILAKDVVERLGAVFAGEDLVAHGGDCRDAGRFVIAQFRINEKNAGWAWLGGRAGVVMGHE
jgi:hypothetical protein